MIQTGNLLSEVKLKQVLALVEAKTTVSGYLLVESDEFLEMLIGADTLDQVIGWVNENY
jgi:hypothetical protein